MHTASELGGCRWQIVRRSMTRPLQLLDQFQGCLLGSALGDALGAPFEGGLLERLLWRLIGKTRRGEKRWTDDTQMTIDVIESFLEKGTIDCDDLANRFAKNYRWNRGYGPGTARILRRIARGADWRDANRSVYPNGTFGNGAAMRSPIMGLIYANRPRELVEAVSSAAAITHAHPLGIEGAVLLASATASVARGDDPLDALRNATAGCSLEPLTSRLTMARDWLSSGTAVSSREVARYLGRGVATHESCVTSLYVALRYLEFPFVEMQRFVASIGGDVDTIGSMAGAIWGSANGAAKLPAKELEALEQYSRLKALATGLHQRAS